MIYRYPRWTYRTTLWLSPVLFFAIMALFIVVPVVPGVFVVLDFLAICGSLVLNLVLGIGYAVELDTRRSFPHLRTGDFPIYDWGYVPYETKQKQLEKTERKKRNQNYWKNRAIWLSASPDERRYLKEPRKLTSKVHQEDDNG